MWRHQSTIHLYLSISFSGSVLVMLMNPVTVTRGRCGCRRCLKWGQKNVGLYKCFLKFNFPTASLFFSPCIKSNYFTTDDGLMHELSVQWLVWVKPMKMLPTACGYSPTLSLVPTASPQSRKTKAVITCSVQRSVKNARRGQNISLWYKCQPGDCKLRLNINYKLRYYQCV